MSPGGIITFGSLSTGNDNLLIDTILAPAITWESLSSGPGAILILVVINQTVLYVPLGAALASLSGGIIALPWQIDQFRPVTEPPLDRPILVAHPSFASATSHSTTPIDQFTHKIGPEEG